MKWRWSSSDDDMWMLSCPDAPEARFAFIVWVGEPGATPDPLLPAWRGTILGLGQFGPILDPDHADCTFDEIRRLAQEELMHPLELLALAATGGFAPTLEVDMIEWNND